MYHQTCKTCVINVFICISATNMRAVRNIFETAQRWKLLLCAAEKCKDAAVVQCFYCFRMLYQPHFLLYPHYHRLSIFNLLRYGKNLNFDKLHLIKSRLNTYRNYLFRPVFVHGWIHKGELF